MPPFVTVNFPLPHGWHSVAPLVLDLPAVQFTHASLGGSLPIVPAPHASKPERAEALILDPSGTTTEEDPPLATIDPASTGEHFDCSGSGCKYPAGHSLHSTLAFLLENLPGEQGMQETEPMLLVYVPLGQGICDAFAPAHV